MKEVKNISDIKELIRESGFKIVGLGSYPSMRFEVLPLVDEHAIFCVTDNQDIEAVRKKARVFISKFPQGSKNRFESKVDFLLSDGDTLKNIRGFCENKIPAIFVYKPSRLAERACVENNFRLLANSFDVFERLDGREEYYSIIKEAGLDSEYASCFLSNFEKSLPGVFEKFGSKIVVQLEADVGGGRSTFFMQKGNGASLAEIKKRIAEVCDKKNPKLVIKKFIEGIPLSIGACLTRNNGTLVTPLQYQLIDVKEVSEAKGNAQGIFCGHDWSLSNRIPPELHKRGKLIAEKIGGVLRRRGALGMFGLDFIQETQTGRLIPIEINPRLLGTYPTAMYVHLMKDEIPLLAFHLLEFLSIDYSYKQRLNYGSESRGAHLLLYNPQKEKITIKRNLPAGRYVIHKGGLKFLAPEIELTSIVSDKEFILSNLVKSGKTVGANKVLLRITARSQIAQTTSSLNEFGKKIVKACIKELVNTKKA